MRPVATSDVLVVRAVKLAVPKGAEVTVKMSPISIVPPIVIVETCFTGTTEVTLVGFVILPPVLSVKLNKLATVSVVASAVENIALVPEPEVVSMP